EIYKTKFDIFMFTLKDDNTKTILSIIYHDYPILKILALMLILWSLSDVVSKALFANLSENSSFYFLKNIDGLLVYIALLISL
ncbi:hypothetical protein ABNO84_10860, partial [Campylobacter jejuni]